MNRDRFNYKKNNVTKSGRVLHSGGPRDLQRKQNSSNIDSEAIVEALKLQIYKLKDELKVSGKYTQDDLEKEVRKSYESIEKKYKEDIENVDKIKSELDKVVYELKSKHDDINTLQNSLKLSQENLKNTELTLITKDDKINDLEERVKEQKEIIDLLKNRQPMSVDTEVVEGGDRPKLQEVFIDPTSVVEDKELKSHVDIKDISIKNKNSNNDKVNKLKSIMGSIKK